MGVLQLTPPSPAMSNGVHHANGSAADEAASMDGLAAASGQLQPEFLGARQLINRCEYIRLLEQALQRLGFGEAARCLERDSVRSMFLPRGLV